MSLTSLAVAVAEYIHILDNIYITIVELLFCNVWPKIWGGVGFRPPRPPPPLPLIYTLALG